MNIEKISNFKNVLIIVSSILNIIISFIILYFENTSEYIKYLNIGLIFYYIIMLYLLK